MGARVFAHLLTADSGSLTSAELVHQLTVSPASVSKSIAYLEAMDLVVRRPDQGSRRERYGIVDDVWLRAWRTDTSAHAAVAAAAGHGAELLGADTPAGARLLKMGGFFGWLSDQMHASGDHDAAVSDALTVLAALGYAARALTVDDLATALGWPHGRVTDAVAAVERQPAIADPLALVCTAPQTYEAVPRQDRLSPAQRDALRAHRPAAAPASSTAVTDPRQGG
jgi:hypothetical protein